MGIRCSVFNILLAFVCLVEGCTKFENPLYRSANFTEEDDCKIYHSSHVVFGDVGQVVQPAGSNGLKSVKFDVKCVYKGDNVPAEITVQGIGNTNGQLEGCPPADLASGTAAVLFLSQTQTAGTFQVEFEPNTGDMDQVLDDLTLACGLTLKIIDQGYQDICFEPIEEECVQCKLPEMPTTTTKKMIESTAKPINKTGDGYTVKTPDDKNNGNGNNNKTPKPGKSVGDGTKDGGNGSSPLMTSSLLIAITTLFVLIL